MRKLRNQKNTVVNNIFSYNVVVEIINNNDDLEPISVEECRYKNDCPKWKDVI